MNNSLTTLWNKSFSHIYIEQSIASSPLATLIIKQFPDAVIIPIKHYKDVFNRRKQSFYLQHTQQKLILAANQGQRIYPGAPVCQNFNENYFYYASNVLNCIYDCEYCYLQGLYPSSNLVLFVNTEDYFNDLLPLLQKHPVYLCISYDTDLLALEPLLHQTTPWIEFAANHPNLTLEIRTKSANAELMKQLPALPNIIYAWTLSPDSVIMEFEHKTPSFKARLTAMKAALTANHPIRLCLDPVIPLIEYKKDYTDMIDSIFHVLSPDDIKDLSFGLFRLSKEYLKEFRRQRPGSPLTLYPYELKDGYYHYPKEKAEPVITCLYNKLTSILPKEKLYLDSYLTDFLS